MKVSLRKKMDARDFDILVKEIGNPTLTEPEGLGETEKLLDFDIDPEPFVTLEEWGLPNKHELREPV